MYFCRFLLIIAIPSTLIGLTLPHVEKMVLLKQSSNNQNYGVDLMIPQQNRHVYQINNDNGLDDTLGVQ